MEQVRLLSLFSGIGAFEKALDNLGIGYELVNYCEIDKYASKSYSAIHGVSEDMNLGDITKVDERALPKDIDLLSYGFPCQDISLSGKMRGLWNEDGTKTRSGLFFDALRIIEETQPKVAIAENVKNLVGKKFSDQFKIVLESLESAGYNNYYQVLNAKDFGVPQNRERVFIVSIRKDIDKGLFKFPKGFPLEKRLKDVLEETVDEKYYITSQNIENIIKQHIKENSITGEGYTQMVEKSIRLGGLYDTDQRKRQAGAIWDKNGLSPTLDTMQGGNRQPFITIDEDHVKVREATKQGYAEAFEGDSINLEQPNSKTRRGRVGKEVAQTLTTSPQQAVVEPIVWDGYNQRIRADQSCVGTLTQNCGADLKRNGQGIIEPIRLGYIPYPNSNKPHQSNTFYDENAVSPTLDTCTGGNRQVKIAENYLRIRKLTPKECFRLQGFDDADFHKAEAVNSNTQLYKQAGNSIVVDVLYYLLKELYENL